MLLRRLSRFTSCAFRIQSDLRSRLDSWMVGWGVRQPEKVKEVRVIRTKAGNNIAEPNWLTCLIKHRKAFCKTCQEQGGLMPDNLCKVSSSQNCPEVLTVFDPGELTGMNEAVMGR